ncbi:MULTISPECIES: FG-GAP-like repeat-containing protein [Flavobacteriaceae]|uniref:FG-GAP-like repeat-containing protein n=1 Tax=Flavobacteriaceae TaxID=49546 RepID=UPI001491E3BA|nr:MULTISPECIES: FG-GAP-like repeat-containing protein [Allomuricauda]MDC6366906.1 FG-GAP-like repeat-containing protein [Muricauda sp. AC10]
MAVRFHRLLFVFILFQLSLTYSQTYFERNTDLHLNDSVSYGDIGVFLGPGISFMDFDNDGWDDITIPSSEENDFQFLRNIGGSFEILDLPITSNGLQSRQVIWVDFDNDGDNDFFAASTDGKCWFYRNDGNNSFTDILELSQIAQLSYEYLGSIWGDYDNDGLLDPFVIVRAPTESSNHSLLYHNNGDGTFTDVTASAGLHITGKMTLSASYLDFDRDGFQDILLANDKDFIANTLYRNNGDGTFADVSILSNMDLLVDGMSTTIEDYDNDGFLDVYITNIYPHYNETSVLGNAFMRNNRDGTFTNIALDNGTRFDGYAWGAIFLDGDNDTNLDLYTNSHLDGSDGRPPSAYFENDGTGNYFIPNATGFENDIARSYGNAMGDIQNDGLPDMVVVNTNNEPIDLWENKTETSNNWLKIKLRGTESNAMGIGSFIKISIDNQVYYRYTICGEGYLSQNSSYEFFGMGPATVVDYIEVTWLSGIVDRIENIDANQSLTIEEGVNPIEIGGGNNEDPESTSSDKTVARQWNEALLNAIRWDYARPTVHARNLFHSSVAMYDAWAILNDEAETVFLGKTFAGYSCGFNGINIPENTNEAAEEIMSYAMYRLILHRFANSPGSTATLQVVNNLFSTLGHDPYYANTDYSEGSYAALGNYLAEQLIAFGLQDGSNESNEYGNQFYTPTNDPLELEVYEENFDLNDPNRWQPLKFENFIDQSGNLIVGSTPDFLSPEWGKVIPFALNEADLTVQNNSFDSYIYNNPGAPPMIQDGNGIDDPYKWNFALVASWSSHLDPDDPTLIDISPGAIGNIDINNYPNTFSEYIAFYDFMEGGDIGTGHVMNPFTQQPYEPQFVKRADYARVLAEFWADGPDSETPPGHWFTILNYVSDHPETIKQFGGEGNILDDLEWDVKAYLALGGAMHDAAVNTWGIKGYYDYVRPISAIRYMSAKGQSSDIALPNYHPHGIPLMPDRIELIEEGDALAGTFNENVGQIKIWGWRGPDFINDPTQDVAGVGWILGTQWWPYQRPSFVTPPFAGYVSGHSTFSRAAAQVLTQITGDSFFPGGMGVFDIEQNKFLVFERGPSENLTLQWATYQDASEQTSLSRIWGGIHPPIDDIPGRIMGEKIGEDAFQLANSYYNGYANFSYDNFLVEVTGESCVDQNDGKITINAKDYYNYQALLNGNIYEFTQDITISDLSPGQYSLCIGVTGNSSEQQCFELDVKEKTHNIIQTSIDELGSVLKLQVDVSGGTPPYKIEINDIVQTEFQTNTVEVSVKKGDVLKISSQLPCEGIYSEVIGESNEPLVYYSNPNTTEARIILNDAVNNIPVLVYTINGQLVNSYELEVNNREIKLPVQNLASGIYVVVLKTSPPTSFKLVKQ